jgi:hypothetical protein
MFILGLANGARSRNKRAPLAVLDHQHRSPGNQCLRRQVLLDLGRFFVAIGITYLVSLLNRAKPAQSGALPNIPGWRFLNHFLARARYICIVQPSTPIAACRTASVSVGCEWQVRAKAR